MNPQLQQLYAELIAEGFSSEEAMQMISSGSISAGMSGTFGNTNPAGTGLFNRLSLAGLRNRFGQNKSLTSLKMPNLKGLGRDIRATQLWDGGPKISTAANTISGLYQGGKALKGLYENSMKDADYNSLRDDISTQIASNPMYDMYMDASDEKLLRQMRNGSLTDNWSNAATGAMQGVPQAAGAALLGGLTGGVPGALIGGIGSLVNSGIQGYGQGTDQANAKLQGLYGRLKQADEEYRSMKRPAGLRRAGLSSQYFNQLY